MIGDATLVPPNTSHAAGSSLPEMSTAGANTATPVAGSATAATSATMRVSHPVSCCHDGFGARMLQPLTELIHADSVQPRLLLAVASEVPPTAMTNSDDDGNCAPWPKPTSPVLATIAMFG